VTNKKKKKVAPGVQPKFKQVLVHESARPGYEDVVDVDESTPTRVSSTSCLSFNSSPNNSLSLRVTACAIGERCRRQSRSDARRAASARLHRASASPSRRQSRRERQRIGRMKTKKKRDKNTTYLFVCWFFQVT
jgi:hypothetical protein